MQFYLKTTKSAYTYEYSTLHLLVLRYRRAFRRHLHRWLYQDYIWIYVSAVLFWPCWSVTPCIICLTCARRWLIFLSLSASRDGLGKLLRVIKLSKESFVQWNMKRYSSNWWDTVKSTFCKNRTIVPFSPIYVYYKQK